jgi:hypothetical protein
MTCTAENFPKIVILTIQLQTHYRVQILNANSTKQLIVTIIKNCTFLSYIHPLNKYVEGLFSLQIMAQPLSKNRTVNKNHFWCQRFILLR